MPYIPQNSRYQYDKLIDPLSRVLNNTKDNDELLGHMNYVLFRLAKLLCSKESDDEHGKRGKRGQRNYARMAVVSSALSEAQAEFRRRVMAPYEDEKIESAGDVEL